jgi:hypothetical protein
MKRTWLALLGASALATAPMATAGGQQPHNAAQQAGQPSGYVSVDVGNVRADIARNLGIDASQVPATVQVPVGVAANACGVDANTLAPGLSAAASCTATSAHTSLNAFVRNDVPTGASGSTSLGAGADAGVESTSPDLRPPRVRAPRPTSRSPQARTRSRSRLNERRPTPPAPRRSAPSSDPPSA